MAVHRMKHQNKNTSSSVNADSDGHSSFTSVAAGPSNAAANHRAAPATNHRNTYQSSQSYSTSLQQEYLPYLNIHGNLTSKISSNNADVTDAAPYDERLLVNTPVATAGRFVDSYDTVTLARQQYEIMSGTHHYTGSENKRTLLYKVFIRPLKV